MDVQSARVEKDAGAPFAKPAGAYRHGDLKNALVGAARDLIVRRNGTEFTMREIAAMTGVRHAAVYRHYASKDALLQEVARQEFELLKSEIEAAGANVLDDKRALEEIAKFYMTFALARPGEYRIMTRACGAQTPHYSGFVNMLREPIAAAQAKGFLRSDMSALMLANILWAKLHGLAMLALDGALEAAEVQECAAQATRLWREGADCR